MTSRRTWFTIVGILMVLFGSTFALQGADYLGGSSMTGSMFWLYAGVGIAILGIILFLVALGFKNQPKSPPSPT